MFFGLEGRNGARRIAPAPEIALAPYFFFFVVDDLEVGVDDVGLLLGLGRGLRAALRGLGRLRGRVGGPGRLLGGLDVGVELAAGLGEALEGGLHLVAVVGLKGLLRLGEDALDLGLLVGGQLVARTP